MIKVYKPQSAYSQQANTKVEKTSFFSGIITFGNKITEYASASTTSAVVYTVPIGKEFYLISATLTSVVLLASPTGTLNSFLYVDVTNNKLLEMFSAINTLHDHSEISISFSVPLRLTSGQQIIVYSGNTNKSVTSSITGYEIDASLIPNFI